jgi:hypothetical protein
MAGEKALFRDSTIAAGRGCFDDCFGCLKLEVLLLLLLTLEELVGWVGLDDIGIQMGGGLAGRGESCRTSAVVNESESVQAIAKVKDLSPPSNC